MFAKQGVSSYCKFNQNSSLQKIKMHHNKFTLLGNIFNISYNAHSCIPSTTTSKKRNVALELYGVVKYKVLKYVGVFI